MPKHYTETFNITQTLDDSDGWIKTLGFSASSAGAQALRYAKALTISNPSKIGVEVMFNIKTWTAGTPDVYAGGTRYVTCLLMPNESYTFPNSHLIDYSAGASSCNGASVDNTAPLASGKWSVGSTDGTSKVGQLEAAISDAAATTTTVSDADGDSDGKKIEDLFMQGDYIRATNEIMLVTGVTTDNSGVITIERGQLGSTATTHADALQLYYFHYNGSVDFDALSDVRTDRDGNYFSSNYFGYGRVWTGGGTDVAVRGLVPASCAIKFYTQGYQELGLSNVTASTSSGLAVSTEYGFDITVDGSGLLDSDALKFTTDASNVNWGGTNGIISKIQEVFDTQFRTTSSNINGEKVTIGIVNGDIRFTSGQHLSTSAILLAAPSAGETTPFGVGAIPAIGDVEGAVPARLPSDTYLDTDGVIKQNTSVFLLDNGDGTMTRENGGSATINYESGAISMRGCPPNASFVVSCNYGSALAGGYHSNSSYGYNQISSINARSINQKADAQITVTAKY